MKAMEQGAPSHRTYVESIEAGFSVVTAAYLGTFTRVRSFLPLSDARYGRTRQKQLSDHRFNCKDTGKYQNETFSATCSVHGTILGRNTAISSVKM